MPLSTKQLDTLSDVIGEAIDDRFERHSTSFDPEKFGEAVGDSIIAALKPLKERIKQLEERTEGMQSKLDCPRRSRSEPPGRLRSEPGVGADFAMVGCG